MVRIVPNSNFDVKLYLDEKTKLKIKEGQKIKYLVDAAPYQEYGTLNGKVENVSNIEINENEISCYIGEATIDKSTLKDKKGKTFRISEGMNVTGKISIGKKRLILWLLEKVNYM